MDNVLDSDRDKKNEARKKDEGVLGLQFKSSGQQGLSEQGGNA